MNVLRTQSSSLLAASILLASVAQAATPTEGDRLHSAMKGRWNSVACELRPQAAQRPGDPVQPSWVTRDFTFDGHGGFSATIVVYADMHCEQPMNEFNFSGHAELGGPSRAARGAREITYVLDRSLSITPRSQLVVDMMAKLPGGACGDEPYRLNVAQSILRKPCILLNNIDSGQVVKDHDLIYLHGSGRQQLLFMGAKHVDGSGFYKPENRPQSGLQVPLIRAGQR